MSLHNDNFCYSDMKNIAQYVLDLDLVSGAAKGIAEFVLENDYSKLTEKQKEIFDYYCVNNATIDCEICCEQIPYCELDSDSKLCARCRHNFNNGD